MTLLIDIKCPRCGKRPAVRISASERTKWMDDPDDDEVMSYGCRYCGEVYPITAKAYKVAA